MTPDTAFPRARRPVRPWLLPLILVLIVLALALCGVLSIVGLIAGACR